MLKGASKVCSSHAHCQSAAIQGQFAATGKLEDEAKLVNTDSSKMCDWAAPQGNKGTLILHQTTVDAPRHNWYCSVYAGHVTIHKTPSSYCCLQIL